MKDYTLHLEELKRFFSGRKLPKEVILGQAITVIDVPKFLQSHFTVLEQPDPKGINQVFLMRLLRLKEVTEQQDNATALKA